MFIENDENFPIVNLFRVQYFYSLDDTPSKFSIIFVLNSRVEAEDNAPEDIVIGWAFFTAEERNDVLAHIRENLINKRGYAKV